MAAAIPAPPFSLRRARSLPARPAAAEAESPHLGNVCMFAQLPFLNSNSKEKTHICVIRYIYIYIQAHKHMNYTGQFVGMSPALDDLEKMPCGLSRPTLDMDDLTGMYELRREG